MNIATNNPEQRMWMTKGQTGPNSTPNVSGTLGLFGLQVAAQFLQTKEALRRGLARVDEPLKSQGAA